MLATRPASARPLALLAAAAVAVLATVVPAAPAAAKAAIEVLPADIGATVGDVTAPWTKANGTNLEGRYEIVDDASEGPILELETVGGAVGVGTQTKFMHYFHSGAYPAVDAAATLAGTDPEKSIPLATLLAEPISATYRGDTYLSLQIEVRYGADKFFTLYQNGGGSTDWTTFSSDPDALWTISGALTDAGGTTIAVCRASGTSACVNGEDVKLANLVAGLAAENPRAISVGVNKGRDTNAANAGLVQVQSISFAGEEFVFALPPTPEPPVAPPAPDSDALEEYIADEAIDVESDTDQFVTTGSVNTDLSQVVNEEPLEGRFENWPDSSDAFADVYSYSTPVHLGTFPVVGGHVILNDADISHLDPGLHHLVFIGQTSGTVRVVALTVVGLAATGSEPPLTLVAFAAAALLGGVALVLAGPALRRRRPARPSRTGR